MQHDRPATAPTRAGPVHAALLVGGLFAGGMLCGVLVGSAAVSRAQHPYAALDLFARVLTTIERDHVLEVPPEQLVDAAIRGMVQELDGQSQWLVSDQFRAWQDDAEGTVTGIGVEVRPAHQGFEVTRVLPDSPALRDGILPGDRILEVDGQPLAGLAPRELRARFNGDQGAPAVLTILRSDSHAPQHIETVRDRIHRPTVEGARLGDGVAYVRMTTFHADVSQQLEREIRSLAEPGDVDQLGGLILDLRDNPGGLLTEAVAVADLFLGEGLIVTTRRRAGATVPDVAHEATPAVLSSDLPLVLLVNGGSASASEIVAASLQEAGRATLVGEPTFGKGTVQQLYKHAHPVPSALKLTVGWYYTRSGEPVAPGEGRQPDHLVPSPTAHTPTDALRERLEQLDITPDDRHQLTELLGRLPASPPGRAPIRWELPVEERLASDPQLAAALDLLAR